MSVSTATTICERIRTATKKSPIAVFTVDKDGFFDAVFANTVVTDKKIHSGQVEFLGSFYGDMGVRLFKKIAIEKSSPMLSDGVKRAAQCFEQEYKK